MGIGCYEDSFSTRRRWLALVLGFLLSLGLSRSVQAHPESLSNLRLVLQSKEVSATLTLPLRDLTGWFPPGRYHNYIADVVGELQKTGDSLLEVSWDDSAALTPLSVKVHPGDTGFIVADVRYARPAAGNTLVVRSTQMPNLPDAHQQVAWLEDERSGAANSRVIAEQVLTAQDDTLTVELPDPPPATQPATAAAGAQRTQSPLGLPSPRAAAPRLAPSRGARHAMVVVFPMVVTGALFVAFVLFKRRLSVLRSPSQSSNWIAPVCGRSS